MTKTPNLKRLIIGKLEFGYCLVFGAWDFLNKVTEVGWDRLFFRLKLMTLH